MRSPITDKPCESCGEDFQTHYPHDVIYCMECERKLAPESETEKVKLFGESFDDQRWLDED